MKNKEKIIGKQTSVYLTPKQKKKLEEESRETGIPMATIIRIALNEYLKRRAGHE